MYQSKLVRILYGISLIFFFSCSQSGLIYHVVHTFHIDDQYRFALADEEHCNCMLHSAVYDNDLDKVKNILKSKSCCINKKDDKGYTPIFYAVDRLESVNNIEKSMQDQLGIFNLLLKHPDIHIEETDNKGRTVLHWLVINFWKAGLESMFNHLQTISQDSKRKQQVSRFINKKDTEGYTAIFYAVGSISKDDQGICRDLYNTRPQHDVLELFLTCDLTKTNIQDRDKDGRTILHWAVENNCAPYVKMILQCAKKILDLDVLQKFVNQKTEIEIDTKNGTKQGGCSALYFAPRVCANSGCKNDIEKKDRARGKYLKPCKRCEKSLKIFKLLIEYQADLTQKDAEGNTIEDCVVEEGRDDMLDLLNQRKATSRINNNMYKRRNTNSHGSNKKKKKK